MEKSVLLHNKTYLFVTEFFAGMAVMAVELGASRLLAPFFSSSQIVWTIIIGTIMSHIEFVAEHPGVPRMMFGELQRAESTPAKRMRSLRVKNKLPA